ncbi:MAG: polyphosphate kinase 1, partial [Saprospiraceae bacterium]|nr:polyphosphate kinase 1 [Saprospiraceae bacterium]
RGICCLIPGIPGVSENIKAISIVDRYLEHARVFIFYHGGKNLVYLSSADWMVRNLSHRIETAFPIYHEPHKKEIIDIIHLQWSDNVKARSIDGSLENPYHKEGMDVNIRSQLETYYYLKRKAEAF